MTNPNRLAGTVYFKVNSIQYPAKGNFKYNLGKPKREAVIGADGVHGFTEKEQVPFIEGEITDNSDFDLEKLVMIDNATVTLELANGKVIVLSEAWYANEGDAETEEANIPVRFEGKKAKPLK